MIEYQERQPFKTLIFLMLIPIIGLISSYKTADIPETFKTVLIIIFGLIIYNFFYLDIKITQETVSFGFGIIKTTVKRSDIVSCEPVTIKFGTYLGMGIRHGFDGTKAYNTRFGKAVRIKVKDNSRDFVVTTDKPEDICSILKK